MGDLIQVLHIAIIVLVLHEVGRNKIKWLSTAWIFTVISTNLAWGGTCPITRLSNFFLQRAGDETYPDLLTWLGSYVGTTNAIAITIACITAPFLWGRIKTIRERKATSASLFQPQS